ncbi:hypothetical protein [Streptomyces sp. NK08204]|uniref:hypothetical protein n=1 Tax=Streptomyces sp. NK08204 TaxID=2873260 RepID=UPI001CEC956E|nr:hypothetical protein [Streptomyces sp. NK08204]
MEWISLASTALGALVGLGATFVLDQARWRRESEQRRRDDRRAVYTSFLAATAEASEILFNIAHGHDTDASATSRAQTVIRDSAVLSRRLELSLVAAPAVMREANRLVDRLRDYRRAVGQGPAEDTQAVDQARVAYNEQRDRLVEVMRGTL